MNWPAIGQVSTVAETARVGMEGSRASCAVEEGITRLFQGRREFSVQRAPPTCTH
jgi:hypothetical protein